MFLASYTDGIRGFMNRSRAIGFNQSGFTLIEVLVAISIFTVAILGVAMSTQSVIRANQENYLTTIATNLAQDKMEELKANPASLASGGPITDVFSGVTFTRTWTVTPDLPVDAVTQIDVTVIWTAYGNRTITVSSAVQG